MNYIQETFMEKFVWPIRIALLQVRYDEGINNYRPISFFLFNTKVILLFSYERTSRVERRVSTQDKEKLPKSNSYVSQAKGLEGNKRSIVSIEYKDLLFWVLRV